MADFTETTATSTAVWTEATATSTTWGYANVDVQRRFGVGRFGVGPFGQGGARSSRASFTEI